MPGVFLSYSRADRDQAERILRGLRAIGVEVWWDQDMPGVNWQDELERQAIELSALVVVWTPSSRNSGYVKDEARLALSHEKLVNVLVGVSAPPFPFDRVNGLPLDDWDGRRVTHGWRLVVETLETKLVASGAAEPDDLTRALARWEDLVREAQAKADRAQEAFADAKAAEEQTIESKRVAAEALATTEERFQRIVDMRPGSAVVHAAQAEIDVQRQGANEAEAAGRAAKAQLAVASRALRKAQRELEQLFEDASATRLTDDGHRDGPAAAQPDDAREPPVHPMVSAPVLDGDPASHPNQAIGPPSHATQPEQPRPPPEAPAGTAAETSSVAQASAAGVTATAGRRPVTDRTLEPTAPLAKRALIPALIIGAGAVAAVVALMILSPHPAQTPTAVTSMAGAPGPPAAAVPASAAPAPSTAAASAPAPAAPPDPNAGLLGSWGIAQIGCSDPVVFAEHDGALTRTFAGVTTDLRPTAGSANGQLNFSGADGARFALKGDSLSMIPAGGRRPEILTRCAG